jgi:hypothetical protein
LRRQAAQIGLTEALTSQLEDAVKNLKRVKGELKHMKKNSSNDRATWLEGLANAQAEKIMEEREGGIKNRNPEITVEEIKEKRLRQLLATEEQRRAARIIKRANGKLQHRSGLAAVTVTEPDGTKRKVEEKEELEQKLIEENI